MVHTLEIYTIITTWQACRILDYQGVAQRRNRYMGSVEVNGIAKMSVYPRKAPANGYILKVILNPAKLLYGYDAFETVPANSSILNQMSAAFVVAMEEATGDSNLFDLANWLVHRIDYAVDIRTSHPELYVKLLKKGDKPKAYYDKADGKAGSCYWGCKSTTGNIYYKADQMNKKGKSPELIERANNLLRFEVQCKSPKVGYLRKNKELGGRELHYFFCQEIAESVLLSYCRRVYRIGDYYSYHSAIEHMKRLAVSKRRINACGNVLRAIAQTRSISEARKQLTEAGLIVKNTNPPVELRYSVEQFGRNCKILSEMNINPVTIPREWNINYLPSIFSMIEVMVMAKYESNVIVTAE